MSPICNPDETPMREKEILFDLELFDFRLCKSRPRITRMRSRQGCQGLRDPQQVVFDMKRLDKFIPSWIQLFICFDEED